MKKMYAFVSLLAFLLVASTQMQAQIVMPDLSPFATITQKVGLNEVRVEYSRPSVRGRVIFGDLVPYGQIWRAGANASTKIYLREAITIQDQHKLAPGIYSLYTIPNKDEWTIIISRDPWLWGAFGYSEAFDVVRFNVKAQQLKDQVETFTIDFANVCTSCAEIQLMWDFTKVSFRISTNLDEKVMADIKVFTTNPEARIAGEYYLSAKYYLDTDRDLKQALEWIDKALKYTPGAYWMTHTKAEIQAKMGDYNAAIETARLSIEEAKAMKSDEYIKINEAEIAKWKEIKKDRKKAGSE
jgi:tetratricopeptide (TPR) repeat protein